MTKEKLLEWGLTEEQANKVMEGLNGSFVTKARFNEVNAELSAAKKTIGERDAQLEGLKKSGADATALQSQIDQLQKDNAQKDKDHAAEIRKIRMDNAVKDALAQAGAINPATVTPLLAAFLEKADLSEDGTVKGLADEISKLAEGEATSFLFKANVTPPPISGASPAGSATTPPDPKATDYETRLADARKAGNSALAVAIKREAAADGVQLF